MADGSLRVHQLTTLELQELVSTSDEGSFVTFMEHEPSLVQLKGERERLERDSLRVARETLDLEPKFSSDRQQLIDSCGTYSRAKDKFESELDSLRTILAGVSPEDVLQELRKQSERKEDESEEVTDSFLAGKYSIDEFLSQFLENRKQAHVFRVKSEQLSKLIRRDQPGRPRTAGFSPNPPAFPSHPPPYMPSQPPAPQPAPRSHVPQW